MTERVGLCKLCANLRCCCCCAPCGKGDSAEIVKDNCCYCNYAALQRISEHGDIEIVYATYHVDVGETPFFIAVDYDRGKIIVSIRGTLSMKVSNNLTHVVIGKTLRANTTIVCHENQVNYFILSGVD